MKEINTKKETIKKEKREAIKMLKFMMDFLKNSNQTKEKKITFSFSEEEQIEYTYNKETGKWRYVRFNPIKQIILEKPPEELEAKEIIKRTKNLWKIK